MRATLNCQSIGERMTNRVMVQINDKKRRGYRLVKEHGIVTVIFPSVTYRMKCEQCRANRKDSDPSVFADWVRTDNGAICPECAGRLGGE